MMRQPKVYHPGKADCVAFRMYDPEQPNVYHPRRADIRLSRCTRTALANANPWADCYAVPQGAALGRIA